MGTLMAALIKYADSDSTKDPESNDEKTGKGKKKVTPRVTSIIRRIRKATVSARLIIVLTLWLTPMHRIMVSIARVNRPHEPEDPVSTLNRC